MGSSKKLTFGMKEAIEMYAMQDMENSLGILWVLGGLIILLARPIL